METEIVLRRGRGPWLFEFFEQRWSRLCLAQSQTTNLVRSAFSWYTFSAWRGLVFGFPYLEFVLAACGRRLWL